MVKSWKAAQHLRIDLFTDDGFISAKDLELSMGRGADVKQMIAAADKNGDGKVREPWTSDLREGIGTFLYLSHCMYWNLQSQSRAQL